MRFLFLNISIIIITHNYYRFYKCYHYYYIYFIIVQNNKRYLHLNLLPVAWIPNAFMSHALVPIETACRCRLVVALVALMAHAHVSHLVVRPE